MNVLETAVDPLQVLHSTMVNRAWKSNELENYEQGIRKISNNKEK